MPKIIKDMKSPILEAIEGGEAMANQTENTEDTTMALLEAASAMAWGNFKIEVGVTPPKRTGNTTSKYDWASFPAPTKPEDPTTWPSVFIPDVGAKTISKSIKAYRERTQKELGADTKVGEFTISTSKEPKGVRVFRKL